jgi:hypothetical protein
MVGSLSTKPELRYRIACDGSDGRRIQLCFSEFCLNSFTAIKTDKVIRMATQHKLTPSEELQQAGEYMTELANRIGNGLSPTQAADVVIDLQKHAATIHSSAAIVDHAEAAKTGRIEPRYASEAHYPGDARTELRPADTHLPLDARTEAQRNADARTEHSTDPVVHTATRTGKP